LTNKIRASGSFKSGDTSRKRMPGFGKSGIFAIFDFKSKV